MRLLIFAFILTISNTTVGATVDTLEIYSPAMQKDIRCAIVLPSNYTVTGAPYPTVYLLHGWSGNYAGWLSEAPQIPELADRYNCVVICPDGGYDSWYIDSPVDASVRYETHIIHEVIPFVEYFFNVKKEKGGRAITGLSMGGHGALLLAARNPEIFGAAGSICGGLDLRPWKKNNWDLQSVLGNPITHGENWEKYSVVNQVDALKKGNIGLIIDCGLDDFFLPMNRTMHANLLAANVLHEYTERPGEHNRAYWSSALDHQILYFHKFFTKDATQKK